MLSDQALTTVKAATAEPGLRRAESSFLESLIEQASAEFQRLLGRSLYYRTGIIERVPGYGTPALLVEEANPVTEIAEVANVGGTGETVIESTTYFTKTDLQGRTSILQSSGCWQWTANFVPGVISSPVAGTERPDYRVEYAGGYVTPNQAALDVLLTRSLPHDIERAVLDRVASLFLQRGRDKTVTTKTTSAGSQAWTDYPPGYLETVNQWRFL